jgi:hypothetical protein
MREAGNLSVGFLLLRRVSVQGAIADNRTAYGTCTLATNKTLTVHAETCS